VCRRYRRSIGTARVESGNLPRGGVSERPKERASKAREGKTSESSNLSATASPTRRNADPRQPRGSAFCRLISCGLIWTPRPSLSPTAAGRLSGTRAARATAQSDRQCRLTVVVRAVWSLRCSRLIRWLNQGLLLSVVPAGWDPFGEAVGDLAGPAAGGEPGVVVAAEQGQVVQIGGAAIYPFPDVMPVALSRRMCTAGDAQRRPGRSGRRSGPDETSRPHRTRRPTTSQPRHQPVWTEHLVGAERIFGGREE
jgi:hypothetical protein